MFGICFSFNLYVQALVSTCLVKNATSRGGILIFVTILSLIEGKHIIFCRLFGGLTIQCELFFNWCSSFSVWLLYDIIWMEMWENFIESEVIQQFKVFQHKSNFMFYTNLCKFVFFKWSHWNFLLLFCKSYIYPIFGSHKKIKEILFLCTTFQFLSHSIASIQIGVSYLIIGIICKFFKSFTPLYTIQNNYFTDVENIHINNVSKMFSGSIVEPDLISCFKINLNFLPLEWLLICP